MPEQTMGPTGQRKNCDTWGAYENRGESNTAAMCHGGWYDGDKYKECPSKYGCRRATSGRSPALNPAVAYGGGSRVLGSTEQSIQNVPPSPFQYPKPYTVAPWPQAPSTVPTRKTPHQMRPHQPQPAPQNMQAYYPDAQHYPVPVQPPTEYPMVMRTPFVASHHVGGTATPTFLPKDKESIAGRLGKNIAQGVVGSAAWHVFDFARSVDMFSG